MGLKRPFSRLLLNKFQALCRSRFGYVSSVLGKSWESALILMARGNDINMERMYESTCVFSVCVHVRRRAFRRVDSVGDG